MIPRAIHAEHLLLAIEEIKSNGVPSRRASRHFHLLFKGERYPPKYVVAMAAKLATGTLLDSESFGGGAETNRYLASMGFTVVDDRNPVQKPRRTNRCTDPLLPQPHNQRCGDCKNTIADMLRVLYGDVGVVKHEHRLGIETACPAHEETPSSQALARIYRKLQSHRGFEAFVATRTLRPSDLFVGGENFLVELDESQHHTHARAAALEAYPDDLPLGFDRETEIKRCYAVASHDNHPPHRDEQRAWYDTLRDFLPWIVPGHQPTVRIAMGTFPWCSLNPRHAADVDRFQRLVPRLPAPRTVSSRGRAPFRIARCVLDIGLRKKSVAALGRGTDRPEWYGSFEAIRERHAASPEAYQRRLKRIVEQARVFGTELLILPACALPYRSDEEFDAYRAILEPIPWVSTGMFASSQQPCPRYGTGEQAALLHNGNLIHRYRGDFPWNFSMDAFNVYGAISSTIGSVRNEASKTLATHPPDPKKPGLVIDMGHNQYTGRYQRTLTSVGNWVTHHTHQPCTTMLSFWHYRYASSRSTWIIDPHHRHLLNERVHIAGDEVDDWVDLIFLRRNR